MSLEIIRLTESLEPRFLEHVNKDPLRYYWFILDWRHQRNDTEIMMAVDGDRIEGMMLIFKKSIAQLRGNPAAVESLLDRLDLEKAEIIAPLDCRDMILKKYKTSREYEMMLMSMEQGQENVQILHKPERLSLSDSAGIAKVVREANQEWWDDVTADRVQTSIRDNLWLGIKREGRLVSVGSTRFADIGSNIGIIATDREYRNRGFATSLVSALVREIFQRKTKALIHVLSDNDPAVRVYTSVGFKPYVTSFMMKHGEKMHDSQR